MSTLALEKVVIGNGTDLASLVIAYHHINHASTSPADCVEKMCATAHEVVEFDALMFPGLDV